MPIESIVALAVLIFTAALLYSSVGHAGASAYIAAMAGGWLGADARRSHREFFIKRPDATAKPPTAA